MNSRGRPRQFGESDALDSAIDMFWRQGFEGTSVDDLTEAMGINRPSFYAAFTNKQGAFEKAVTRYIDVELAYVDAALAQPTARTVAESYLRSNADAVLKPGRPRGCLSIQGGLTAGPKDAATVEFLTKSRRSIVERFVARFESAIAAGDLAPTEDPADLANYLNLVSSGLAVQATGGATAAQLASVVERALKSFPA
jgi:AcrR family transcriptional regulator